jgi:hypothetical protein
MGEALVKGIARRVDDVGRRVEIRLPNLEMNNVAAFRLQRSRLDQNFESGLGAETRHTLGEAEFMLRGLMHHGESSSSCRFSQLSTIGFQLSQICG